MDILNGDLGSTIYLVVFLALLAESTVVVGLFAPGVSIYVAASFLAGSGSLDWRLVWLVGAAAVFLGDNIGYALGRISVRSCKLRAFVKRSGVDLEAAPRRSLSLFFYQFPVVTRAPVPIVMGARGLSLGKWLSINLPATVVFTGVILLPGYVAGRTTGSFAEAERFSHEMQIAFLALAAIWVVYAIIRWRCMRRRIGNQSHSSESPESVHETERDKGD